jgi:hypothetical protein
MPVTTTSVTIPAGQSLSGEVDVSAAGKMLRIITPDAWTPANLSFQVADVQAGPYKDSCDHAGNPLLVACPPASAIVLGGILTLSEGWLKLRSGSASHPVVQGADRTFSISVLR